MTISTFDGFIGAAKSNIGIRKTAARTTVANNWFSVFDLAGNPGSGTLAGTSTTAGVVPTDATSGTPDIPAFGGSNLGYLAQVDFGNTVACRMKLFDLLWKGGAYAFTGQTNTLSSQATFTRCPSYADLQIWIEVSTAFATGTAWSVQVTYTNQAGTTGRTGIASASMAAAALTQGKMLQLALQAGDQGVQKIESVIVTNDGTEMTAGAFNVLILRPLWTGRCRLANDGDTHDLTKTGFPQVYADSALFLAVNADSTSTGIPELDLVIANG